MSIQNQLYKKYRRNAESRQVPFDLEEEEFTHLTHKRCHYCGAEPSNTFKYNGKELEYNGLDRIDSGLGYTTNPNNVLSCCRFCNTLKSSMRPEAWFDFLVSVIKTHAGQPPIFWFDYEDEERSKKAVNFWKVSRR